MNYTLSMTFPHPLLLKNIGPCISLYMPTHRVILDKQKDILLYKKLIKEAILSLEKLPNQKTYIPLKEFLQSLPDDFPLWNEQRGGMAIFTNTEEMIIYRLDAPVEPLVIVANSFHIKPLVHYYQMIEEFIILSLEAERFSLYKGNMYDIKPYPLPEGTKTTLKDILGDEFTDSYLSHGTHGGASGGINFHGHGGKSEADEIDRPKYFRQVDRLVYELVSKDLKLPIILATAKDHQFEFLKQGQNPYILLETIDGTIKSLTEKVVLLKIKDITYQRYVEKMGKIVQTYHEKKYLKCADQLDEIIHALVEGRVDILMVEQDRIIPGRIDSRHKQFIPANIQSPRIDDVLDDLIQYGLQTGSKVYILPKDMMPTTSGVAVICRY
jgi:hypothetical protein